MAITYHEESREFHIYNNQVSYIIQILRNDQLGQLYYGKKIKDRTSFGRMLQVQSRILAPCVYRGNLDFSLEVIKQEYPSYGTGDYREPAYQLLVDDGSRITDFKYKTHTIYGGKKQLENLPATYGVEEEVTTLEIIMYDEKIACEMKLRYHIFEEYPVITREVSFENKGASPVVLERAMSASVDFYDADFELLQLDGAWSRERHVNIKPITSGTQGVSSIRGASSASHNPFIALKRKNTTETEGEVYGFSLVYSGNFLAQAEVDCYNVTRVLMGIHPFEFQWTLNQGESFQTPEAVMVYSDTGLNGMSQAYHSLYRNHLVRGFWKDKVRPILINNWEATYFDFTESSILKIASKAKQLGVELFVLDDGWFGERNNDGTSLGDWYVNTDKLPNGIEGLCEKINDLGMKFGLWFEPEMVNEISDLYSKHKDWIIGVPGREHSYGRNQYVLDFSRKEVVDYIYECMAKILHKTNISYVKWDMNRNITEAFSLGLPKNRQREFYHRYILGVYDLYERLTTEFPKILFESCASGGARFDPGMLYYAPQAWTSDDTDAIERLHIQYGTSMVYPINSMGSHVSAIPNHQVNRKTSLKMRGDVAYFGTFGYELDVTKITPEEEMEIFEQIKFFKEYREVIQFGDFYRLQDGSDGKYSWIAVSKDKKSAVVGDYKILATPNPPLKKFQLAGLNPDYKYYCTQREESYYGDELMHFGMLSEVEFTGVLQGADYKGIYHPGIDKGDFTSHIYTLKAE